MVVSMKKILSLTCVYAFVLIGGDNPNIYSKLRLIKVKNPAGYFVHL